MSVVASDILFVRGDGGYRPGLTSPVASLDLVKQTGGPHSSSTVSSKDSAVFDEFHHSPRWLAKNRHNAQKAAKYKQLFGSQPRPDGPASSGTPPVSGLTSVTPVSGPAGQTGSGGRRPPLPAARSSLSSITSLILGTNRFRQRSAKANHRSTTVLNTAKEAVNHTSTTIITGSPVPGGGRSEPAADAPSPIKGNRRPPTWIEKALRADTATPSQLPAPLRLGRQSEPAQRLGDVTGRRDVVTDDVKGRPPRPGRPARISLVTVSAAEQAAAATQQSASERGDSASGVGAASGPQTDAGSVPVAPPRRRRPTGRLTSSVGDLLDSGERRPRLVPHGVPTATTRLTIPLSGLRGPPAAPAGTHSRPELDSSHDSSLRGHDSATPAAPRPQPRRHSKSTGSLLFAGETPGSPPRAAPRALKFSIGRALTEHGARTSVQLTSDGASETQPERQSRQEPRPESKRPSEPEQEPDRTPPSLFERTGELKSGSRASIRVQSPPRQPVTSLPEPRSAELETDSSSADGSDSPPSLRRVLSPLSADSVSDLSAAAGSERRTYRSRRPVSTTASPATPLLSSQDRRRPQSAFNARRTIAHRRQAEAAARSASEPRRRHTATWVTGKINVSVTSVGRAASLTQLGAGGGTRALTVSDRSSSSPTLEQEKRDIRRYLYCTNLTSGDESPERERRLSESCLRLGAPAAGDELPERPADPRLLSPDSIGSCWSAVTADVLTVRDTADERSDVTGDRCDVFGGRTDAAMTLETEDERPPSSISTAASTGPRRRLSTSVVHLWGPDESHLLPSGPSSLPSTRPARPHSLSSSTLLGGTDQQPSWLPRSQERRSLRDGLKGDAWSRTADPAQSPTTLLTASVEQPAEGLANGQPAEPRLSSESRPPAGGHGPRPALLDLSANADVELSSEVPPEPPSCPPPDSPTESPCDLPPPVPSQPPPDSPPGSPPPLPSVPPPESPTDSGPEPLWTSRFERPRRQSLSTSLPSFATVPVVSDGSASVGRKPPSVAPSLWSDDPPAAPIGRPAARRPLRPAGLASDAGRGPSSLPAVTPGSGAGAADCTAQWTGAGGGAAAASADRHTVQVRVARPERSPETAGSVQRRRASTGVYLNGAAPAAESRTQTSFTISLGGARKRPSLFSQRSSPSLLSTSQPASLPTLSSKSPTSPPPAKQPLSLSGLRAARRPLSTPAVQAPPATASDRQPVSLPGLFYARQPTPSAQREPTSLPAATRLPKSPPPSRSQPSLPKSPPPSRPPPSLPKSPPPSRSPPRSPAASRTEDSRRGSSELQRQLEDDWARMERRHQAFLRHTAQQRGQPAPRSILKKQSAPSLLESVASESRPGWERAEQPRRRASNVNWHDLERTKQQIRSEIERMKRQLRSEIGGSGSRAGPWPPRPAASSAASATSSTSGRTVVETIHAIHIERDSSPGLVITEVDDADDAASNHSGVVIEEIFDDEPDAAAPAGDADSLPRPAAQERSHPGPAVSEPQPQPSPSPWWRTPVAAASAATETSHLPGWRRPTQPATAVSGADSRLLHSAGSVSERLASGGGLSDGERQHVQVEQLSATSVSGEQQRDLSMTHFRHLYVDKRKTVHIGTADGGSAEWLPTASETAAPPAEPRSDEPQRPEASLWNGPPQPGAVAQETKPHSPLSASLESELPQSAAAPETETAPPAAAPSTPSSSVSDDLAALRVSDAQASDNAPKLLGSLETSECKAELNRLEEDIGRTAGESVIGVEESRLVTSIESCQSSVVDRANEAQEDCRQSVLDAKSSITVSDTSCRLSEKSDLSLLNHSVSKLPSAQESQSLDSRSDASDIFKSSPGERPETHQLPEESQKPHNSRTTSESPAPSEKPQSSQQPSKKSRRMPPASTFGSWKARHAGLVAPGSQAGRSGSTAVGRSVEVALGRLLAGSGRADRGTQVTQKVEPARSGAATGRPVSRPRPAADRGVTPPRQHRTGPGEGTPAQRVSAARAARQAPSAPSHSPSVPRQEPPTTLSTTSRVNVDQRKNNERSRAAGPNSDLEAHRGEERRHGGPRSVTGDRATKFHRTAESARTQTKPSSHRNKADSGDRNSATNGGSRTENLKPKPQTKPPPATERVQNTRLVITHKLNASSPHFYTEMQWNEMGTGKARHGRSPSDGESTAPDETRHYHSVAADGASVTSRVVTPGGDLRTTFSTSTTSGTSPGRPRSPAPGRRPASAAPRPDYLSHSSRPSKSVHGCSITVQEFIV